jgi:predicted amino acid racemase
MEVLRKATDILHGLGITVTQVNAPSANCVSSMCILKASGATHGEPGHAFTGTTPLHAWGGEPEKVAMIYVTEVSHRDRINAYVFGGGFYPRSHVKNAYSQKLGRVFETKEVPAGNIDYYGTVLDPEGLLHVGDTLVYAFRTQVFFTRAKVAVLDGIENGNPQVVGIFDSRGRQLR